MISYECDRCNERMESPDSLLGQFQTCPECGAKTKVPAPAAAPRPPATKTCPHCRQRIDAKATRCNHCAGRTVPILTTLQIVGLSILGFVAVGLFNYATITEEGRGLETGTGWSSGTSPSRSTNGSETSDITLSDVAWREVEYPHSDQWVYLSWRVSVTNSSATIGL